MALKIVWTPQAEKGLNDVITFLEKEWSAKEILSFRTKLKSILKSYK